MQATHYHAPAAAVRQADEDARALRAALGIPPRANDDAPDDPARVAGWSLFEGLDFPDFEMPDDWRPARTADDARTAEGLAVLEALSLAPIAGASDDDAHS